MSDGYTAGATKPFGVGLVSRLGNLILPAHDLAHEEGIEHIRGSRLRGRLIALCMLLVLVWAGFFTLDVASLSLGEVVSSSQTKQVQHLEGGIVRSILVREGQSVKMGDPLIELERIASESDMGELETQIAYLRIKSIRLEAQIAGQSTPQFPPDLLKAFPKQVQNARELMQSQSVRVGGNIQAQSNKVTQRSAELSELAARKQFTQSKLNLLREQLAINEKLMKEGLANQYEQLNLLKEEQALVGALAEVEASIRRVVAAESQESASLRAMSSGEQGSLQSELADTRKQLSELQERSLKFSDRQKRLQVLAPIDGTVLRLNIVTEGGVVAPGGVLLSLVPSNDPLVIETQLPVGDIGLVKSGQKVRIELVSGTARGFPPISGTLAYVSADRVLEPNREPYYRARIVPAQDHFTRGELRYPLVPGVRVSASILIGHRSVLDFLIDPLRAGARNALTEP
ncbi:MAG: HlyD family type I secretion periplasmic adaptor subunit [Rhodoferax sp.]|nr:HlyD family type I secretion periplasmic adaptor subunit [Rhodoferax sp.]